MGIESAAAKRRSAHSMVRGARRKRPALGNESQGEDNKEKVVHRRVFVEHECQSV